jgi:uncharacterized protein YneF (UPF0154 family)
MGSQNDKEGSVTVGLISLLITFVAAIIGIGIELLAPVHNNNYYPTTTNIAPTLYYNPTSTAMMIRTVIAHTGVAPSESSPVEIAVLNINSKTQADGTVQNTASLSISPLGLGTLQLTSPSTIKFGESSIIRLAITPDSVLANLPRVTAPAVSTNSPEYVLEFSDRLQIYPVMIAELKGVNFDIESDNRPEKPVISTMPVEWIWNVTPLSAGKQTLILSISVPVIIDQTRDVVSAQTLKNIPIEIQVEVTPTPIPSKTPKPTQTPLPTFTPTPLPPIARIGEKLIENVTTIIVAMIGLIGVLAGVYVTYINAKKN